MPRAKKIPPSTRPPIKISRVSHTQLIDPHLKRSRSSRLLNTALVVAVITFIAVSALTYYMLFHKKAADDSFIPEIIVPAPSPSPQASSTPTTTPQAEAAAPVVTQNVEILATPTGYLNVRKGPGTNFAKVTEVHPGETYVFVSEDAGKGWYEIKLDTASTGWVTKQYAKIK